MKRSGVTDITYISPTSRLGALSPSPSCPCKLAPQPKTRPSAESSNVCAAPQDAERSWCPLHKSGGHMGAGIMRTEGVACEMNSLGAACCGVWRCVALCLVAAVVVL